MSALVIAQLVQRRADAPLARGLPARAVVAAVIHVEAVQDVRDAQGCGFVHGLAVELGLAEVAPVGGIGRVPGVVELVGIDEEMPGADALRQAPGVRSLFRREAGRHRGQRQGVVPEDVHGLGQQVARIDAAGETDHHVPHLPEQRLQPGYLAGQAGGPRSVVLAQAGDLRPVIPTQAGGPEFVIPAKAGIQDGWGGGGRAVVPSTTPGFPLSRE